MKDINTVIVGGGIAGLYCAWRLKQKNTPFVLLEAQPQLGGRIQSESLLDEQSLAIDLGPTWYWPHQLKMRQLVTDLQLDWFEQYTTGDAIYQMQPNQPVIRNAGAGAMTSFRIKGGMAAIVSKLMNKIDENDIKLNHPVYNIERVEGHWCVSSSNSQQEQQYRSKSLILALPPRMIIQYLTPERFLSADLVEALSKQPTWMAAQAKFVAVYETPFWREQGLAGQAFSRVGPMVEIHDASGSENNGFALFGFIGVPYEYRQKSTPQQLQSACLKQLATLFGSAALNPQKSYATDWGGNRWIASAKDREETPKHPDINLSLYSEELKALDLYLVSSEFAQQEAGYLEGALTAVDTAMVAIHKHV